jgi:NAD(P)H-hydrate epimerase
MENAGRNAARVIRREVLRGATTGSVAIVCGGGNNGGDGFVVARHLVNVGVGVEVFLAVDPTRLTGDAATNWRIVERMNIPAFDIRTPDQLSAAADRWRRCDAILDALLGTGFAGQVRAPLDAVIDAINALHVARAPEPAPTRTASGRPVIVAIDLPSGLDADSGQPANATVRADLTITMVARKIGFDRPGAADFTGRVDVVDIGAPRPLIQQIASR